MFIFDSINMKIFYFQNCVERFNVKMSIIAMLGVDLEYWLLSVNKYSTLNKAGIKSSDEYRIYEN